jgi:hypothetical protein
MNGRPRKKKKLWANWLSADGLHPLAIALRIARNVAGSTVTGNRAPGIAPR